MNIGKVIYETLVRYAEGGKRVTKVTLPDDLFEEYATEPGMTQMMRTLAVEVVAGEVDQPQFELGSER